MDIEIIMPQMGESIAEATIVRWMKHEGDTVEQDESVAEIESDKAVVELPSPAKGVIVQILVPEQETVPVGTVIARLSTERPAAPEPAPAPVAKPAPAAEPAIGLSPVVSRLVAEHGLDPRQIVGTGTGGRLTKKDVLAHLARQQAPGAPAEGPPPPAPAPPPPPPPPSPAGLPAPRTRQAGDRVVPLEGIRAAIADHLVASVRDVPHVTTVAEVDMTACVALRTQWKDAYAQRGLKLTYLPLIAQAVCRAVPQFPGVNASLKERQITYFGHVHLGISVAREQGLVVVVIPEAETRSVADLAAAIGDLAERARTGKLKPAETRGATLTITNPGSLGAVLSTPIIPAPQAAIVSIQAMHKRPVVVTDAAGHDAIGIRTMMYLGLSYDHRIIDGAEAIGFLQAVRRILEAADFVLT